MNFDLIYFFLFYFLILFAILGYGKIFNSFVFKEKDLNLGYHGLSGVFFLIIYSYISHYFIAHDQIHNLIILIFGNVLFFSLIKNSYKKKKLCSFFYKFSHFIFCFIIV